MAEKLNLGANQMEASEITGNHARDTEPEATKPADTMTSAAILARVVPAWASFGDRSVGNQMS